MEGRGMGGGTECLYIRLGKLILITDQSLYQLNLSIFFSITDYAASCQCPGDPA